MGEDDSRSNATGEDVYFHLPGVASARWDRSIHAVVETREGWADADEFRAILDAGVQAMSENRGSSWLADCRLQRVLKAADQEAGNRWWLPRALAAGLKRFAVVLPASGLAKANIQDHLRAAASKQLDMAYLRLSKKPNSGSSSPDQHGQGWRLVIFGLAFLGRPCPQPPGRLRSSAERWRETDP